jgi:hypothetical protein
MHGRQISKKPTDAKQFMAKERPKPIVIKENLFRQEIWLMTC